MDIGRRIIIMRAARGMTQSELAAHAQVDPGLLSHIEKGKVMPVSSTLDAIKEALMWTPEVDAALAVIGGAS